MDRIRDFIFSLGRRVAVALSSSGEESWEEYEARTARLAEQFDLQLLARVKADWADIESNLSKEEQVVIPLRTEEKPYYAVIFDRDEPHWSFWIYAIGAFRLEKRGMLLAVEERRYLGRVEKEFQLRIQDFTIRGDLRSSGIGSAVLTKFIQLASQQGCSCITGSLAPVDARNGSLEHLARFYSRHGFTVTLAESPRRPEGRIRLDLKTEARDSSFEPN